MNEENDDFHNDDVDPSNGLLTKTQDKKALFINRVS